MALGRLISAVITCLMRSIWTTALVGGGVSACPCQPVASSIINPVNKDKDIINPVNKDKDIINRVNKDKIIINPVNTLEPGRG